MAAVVFGSVVAAKLPVYASGTRVYMEIPEKKAGTGKGTIKTGDTGGAGKYLVTAGAAIGTLGLCHRKRKYSEIKGER